MEPFSKTIAVFGSSAINQDSDAALEAERLGRLLAEAKLKICNGGYMGVMEACSRGARGANGQITGVVCSAFSRRQPNPYLNGIVEAHDLPDRIATLMRMADAYIVLDGNIGTLAELFVAWNVVATGWNKPVLVIGEGMKQALYGLQTSTEIRKEQLQMLKFMENVDEAVEWLKRFFRI